MSSLIHSSRLDHSSISLLLMLVLSQHRFGLEHRLTFPSQAMLKKLSRGSVVLDHFLTLRKLHMKMIHINTTGEVLGQESLRTFAHLGEILRKKFS